MAASYCGLAPTAPTTRRDSPALTRENCPLSVKSFKWNGDLFEGGNKENFFLKQMIILAGHDTAFENNGFIRNDQVFG
jgi:hypothetical protein